MAYSLCIHSNTSLQDALSMPVSVVEGFFGSKVFEDSQKAKEAEIKMQSEIVTRLNGVIGACGAIVKSISRIR